MADDFANGSGRRTSPRQVALGLFIFLQLGFLIASNATGYLVWVMPTESEDLVSQVLVGGIRSPHVG